MSNFNGQEVHPHVSSFDPAFLSTPQRQRYRPASPHAQEEGLGDLFDFTESRPLTLLDIDVRNGVRNYPPTMPETGAMAQPPIAEMSLEQRLLHLTALAEEQQRQMAQVKEFANSQTEALKASKEQLDRQAQQLQDSQHQVSQLTTAFENLSTRRDEEPRPHSNTQAPKKKPELPPFDPKNIIIWIRRIEAAYIRVGVIEPKDKFAWLESMFQVGLDPTIDAFLYGDNTATDWDNFIAYLKKQYAPTIRHKAQKLLGEIQRHDLMPSQFFKQMVEDTKDVKVDDIRKEHLLRSIPPRIREMLGKEVESMTGEEVAAAADSFFDRKGKPLEKNVSVINNISNATPTSANTSANSTTSSSFTNAFVDNDETDVNFVRRGGGGGGGAGGRGGQHRSRSRNPRSGSRPGFNRSSSSASSASQQNQQTQQQQQQSHPPGTCRFHRRFGDKSLKCVTDCPYFATFKSKQGNGQGGRR